VQYVVYAATVFLLVRSQSDARETAIAFGLGVAAAVVVLWIWYIRDWGPLRIRLIPGIWKEILKNGIPVGAAMFLAQSVTNFPPLVIGYFSGSGEVGLFSSAMKLVFLMMLVDRILNALFLPAATRYFSFERDDFPKLVETTLRVVLLLIIPIALCGIILSGELVTLVFGAGYLGGSPLLQILMVFFVLTVVNSVFVCVLVASGNEGRYTRMVTMGSLVLCGATLIGTMTDGAVGSAWGVVLGELVTTSLMGKEALKVVRLPLGSLLIRPLLAAVCVAPVVALLYGMNALALAIVAVFVFVSVEIVLKGITLKEIRFLRERFV
jgi:O-antigen/teichoic acid export membrane protein